MSHATHLLAMSQDLYRNTAHLGTGIDHVPGLQRAERRDCLDEKIAGKKRLLYCLYDSMFSDGQQSLGIEQATAAKMIPEESFYPLFLSSEGLDSVPIVMLYLQHGCTHGIIALQSVECHQYPPDGLIKWNVPLLVKGIVSERSQ